MNALVLDTSAYSWAARGHAELEHRLSQAERMVAPAVTLGELLSGFRTGHRESRSRDRLTRFLNEPWVQLAPVGEATAERYAIIAATLRTQGTPLGHNAMWIAAVAMECGFPVLTTDQGFHPIPQIQVECIAVP